MTRASAAVFLNEGAGSAASAQVRRAVELARHELGADLHVIAKPDASRLRTWLDERVDDYATAIIAGGDGSLSIACSVPDLWRRRRVEVAADGWTVRRGPFEMLVVGTTPFYGRGLRVNPGARPDAGLLSLRVYPGPAPRLAIEAGRWALGAQPRAERVDATRIELRSLDGAPIPVQADGDVIGSSTAWTFEVQPAAVRLIGRWS